MPKTLPKNATSASRRLYDLAVLLAKNCPPELASEIALVGSAAMGLSDDQSDLDINFWAETIPPEAERVKWLESMGATDFNVQPPRPDDSYGIGCVIDGVDVGCSWQTFDSLNVCVERAFQGDTLDERNTWLVVLIDVVVQAITIRSTGRIEAVQQRLGYYPDTIRQRCVLGLTRNVDAVFRAIPKVIRYGDDLSLTSHVSIIVGDIIEGIYPINRRWYPQRKWRYKLAADLLLKPPNLHERIGLVLHDPDLHQRPIHLARLMLDTLALIKDEYDVSADVATIEAFIKENG